MSRRLPSLVTGFLLLLTPNLPADAFDRYVNPVIARAPQAEGAKELKELTPSLISEHENILPDSEGALLVMKTNESRYSKLLVQNARRKVGDKTLPILIIERFVTFKEGEERAVHASGGNIHLFAGFEFNLDIGQVVPAGVGGDLRFVVDGKKVFAEPLGKAKLFLLTKPLPGTEPKKSAKPVIGDVFEPRFFNGTFKLFDDGRRSGTITLQVDAAGAVTGSYISDKDGQKYDVYGKVTTPKHAIQFTIKFPRTEQVFQGWMFTGDGNALTGSSRLQDRETGFYALRADQD
jgi:hypothetical protein